LYPSVEEGCRVYIQWHTSAGFVYGRSLTTHVHLQPRLIIAMCDSTPLPLVLIMSMYHNRPGHVYSLVVSHLWCNWTDDYDTHSYIDNIDKELMDDCIHPSRKVRTLKGRSVICSVLSSHVGGPPTTCCIHYCWGAILGRHNIDKLIINIYPIYTSWLITTFLAYLSTDSNALMDSEDGYQGQCL